MIMKDEEENLERCLESVKSIIDNIIIVDTGSTDSSIAIAQSFGAKVIPHPWEGDFSAARNVGLLHVQTEWVLVLDADEVWDQDNNDLIIELLKDEQVDGYFLEVVNYYGNSVSEEDFVTDMVCRLFRYNKKIAFQGTIHEEVTTSIFQQSESAILAYTSLQILHYGYLTKEIERKKKNERNIQIVKEALEKDSQDHYMRYALGTEYYQSGQLEEALEVLEPLIDWKGGKGSYQSDLLVKVVAALNELGQMEKALNLIEKGLHLYPDFPELLEQQCLVLFQLDRYEEAESTCRKVINIEASTNDYSLSSGTQTFHALFILGLIYERKNNVEKAMYYYFQSLDCNEFFSPAFQRLVELKFIFPEVFESFQKPLPIKTKVFLHFFLERAAVWRARESGMKIVKLEQVQEMADRWLIDYFEGRHSSDNESWLWANLVKKKQWDKASQLKKYEHVTAFLQAKLEECLLHPSDLEDAIYWLLMVEDYEQAYPLLNRLLTENKRLIPMSHFPLLRQSPERLLKEYVRSCDEIKKEWTYNELVMIAWMSIKAKEYALGRNVLRLCKAENARRLDHIKGVTILLNEQGYMENKYFPLDSLLVIF